LNFQSDTKAEAESLDKILGFDFRSAPILIGSKRDIPVGKDNESIGFVDGHEGQRMVVIDFDKLQALT